jgi:hypothetical protein
MGKDEDVPRQGLYPVGAPFVGQVMPVLGLVLDADADEQFLTIYFQDFTCKEMLCKTLRGK